MSDQVIYLVLRDVSRDDPLLLSENGLIETVPVSAFADRIEAECEIQRLRDGDDHRASRRKWIMFDYRIEGVILHG